jgi:hypothetical protein
MLESISKQTKILAAVNRNLLSSAKVLTETYFENLTWQKSSDITRKKKIENLDHKKSIHY